MTTKLKLQSRVNMRNCSWISFSGYWHLLLRCGWSFWLYTSLSSVVIHGSWSVNQQCGSARRLLLLRGDGDDGDDADVDGDGGAVWRRRCGGVTPHQLASKHRRPVTRCRSRWLREQYGSSRPLPTVCPTSWRTAASQDTKKVTISFGTVFMFACTFDMCIKLLLDLTCLEGL